MKNSILGFLILSYISIFFFSCINSGEKEEIIIDINDARDIGIPAPDFTLFEYREVEIFRVEFENDAYGFGIYGIDNDTLRRYTPFMCEIEDDFNKAAYYWDNDTILLVRFFHTDSDKEMNFRLSGNLINELGSASSTMTVLDR